MSKFWVNDSFAIESRRLFVLAGAITEGPLQTGMTVSVPLNSSISVSAPIHSIEYLRRDGGREDVCLCIACEDPDELELWQGLNIKNETVEIE
ncbi:hypothetical protein [Bradyrhizobium sp. HKCCYLS20291]|uniref:hypothetical protein n=1 Tax=Bradyrhizobium sp. HKCCYLS20291 TaxID=3420766 RepID=UPI003EC0545E